MNSEVEHFTRLRDDADQASRNLRSALFHFRALTEEADDYDMGGIVELGLDRAAETITRYIRKLQELTERFDVIRGAVQWRDAPPEERAALAKIVRGE